MKLFLLLFVTVGLAGCAIFSGQKPHSSWFVLEKSEKAECGLWPKQADDLAINDIALARGAKKGFLASGLNRDGSSKYYYLPFKGEIDLAGEDLVPLKLGRHAVLLGGGMWGGKPIVDVAYNAAQKDGTERSSFELRNVKDNLVRHKAEFLKAGIGAGTVVWSADAHWIVYQDKDGASDFGIARLALGAPRSKSKIGFEAVPGLKFKERPALIPVGGGQEALVIGREGDAGKPFQVRKIDASGRASNPSTLELAAENGVESWAAAAYGGSNYIVYVDGDSLIGQAELKVAAFEWRDDTTSVKWSKGLPLKDVHVSDPVFVASSKGLQVMALNWVDDESTIARYIVAAGTVGKPVYSGVFRKGSRIVEAFSDDGDLYAVMRHKDDVNWVFQLCKL